MPDLLDLIRQIDLPAAVNTASELVQKIDPYFIAVIVLFLVLLGSRMVAGQSKLQSLGLRLAAAAFLIYCGWGFYQVGSFDSEHWPGIALRGANAAGTVLAMTWIVLPILAFLYEHIRLALSAFLGWSGYEIYRGGTIHLSWEQLRDIALRAALIMLLALIVAWILSPIIELVKSFLPKPPKKKKDEEETDKGEEDEEEDEAERKPRREKHRRRRRVVIVERREPEATVPPPQSVAQVTVNTVAETPVARLSDESHRRRELVRMRAELSYLMAARDLGSRFTREMFDDFRHRYLGDHLPAEEVEQNGRQFQELLQQKAAAAHEPPRLLGQTIVVDQHANGSDLIRTPEVSDLEGLSRWFAEEQQRIHGLTVEPQVKLRKLMVLNDRYTVLASRFIEQNQPV